MGRKPFSPFELDFIRANANKKSFEEIGEALGRNPGTIRHIIARLAKANGQKFPVKRPALKSEIQFMREHAGKWPIERIAFELKRLPQFVAEICERQGIA